MIEIINICAEQENEADHSDKIFLTIENALKDKIDTNDFDVLIQTSAQLIRDGQALPLNLANFVADVLEKKRSRPTKHGPDPYRDFIRNVKLSFIVEAIVYKFGIARYVTGHASGETAVDSLSKASKFSVNTVINALRLQPIPPEIAKLTISRLGVKYGALLSPYTKIIKIAELEAPNKNKVLNHAISIGQKFGKTVNVCSTTIWRWSCERRFPKP